MLLGVFVNKRVIGPFPPRKKEEQSQKFCTEVPLDGVCYVNWVSKITYSWNRQDLNSWGTQRSHSTVLIYKYSSRSSTTVFTLNNQNSAADVTHTTTFDSRKIFQIIYTITILMWQIRWAKRTKPKPIFFKIATTCLWLMILSAN